MDFSFNIESLLRCDQNGLLIINSSHKKFMKFDYFYYLEMVINSIGSLSSVQRRLKSPITNADLFFGKQNETLIIKAKGNTVYGFIRVGYKDLYINTLNDILEKVNLLCVFDFFVHFTCQRMGYGKELFDKVLEMFKVQPAMMAYDKPSQAMSNFLYKHYSLKNPIEQNNHMFIYYQLLLKLINENYNNTNNNNRYNDNYYRRYNNYYNPQKRTPQIETYNDINNYRRSPQIRSFDNNNNQQLLKLGNFIMKNYTNSNEEYMKYKNNKVISKSSDYSNYANNSTEPSEYRSRCFSPYEANVLNSIQSDNTKKFHHYYLMNDHNYNNQPQRNNDRYQQNRYNPEAEYNYYQ